MKSDNYEDILIPIADILIEYMEKYDCDYDEEFFMKAREFFIACLNMKYIYEDSLDDLVEKFCKTIKTVEYTDGVEDGYRVEDDAVYFDSSILDDDEEEENPFHSIDAYSLIFEVISDTFSLSESDYPEVAKLFAHWAAFQLFLMNDLEDDTLPVEIRKYILGATLMTTKYYFGLVDNTTLNLLKMALLSWNIEERVFFNKLLFYGFKTVRETLFRAYPNANVIFKAIETLEILENLETDSDNESLIIIDSLQRIMAESFEFLSNEYLQFIDMVFEANLRRELIIEGTKALNDD